MNEYYNLLSIQNCMNCDICMSRKSIVNGIGVKDAPIMFVGASPGYSEDKYNVPFIGKAGKLLRKLTYHFGIHDLSYFTYMSRCYPGNRRPSNIELSNCIEYFNKEFKLCNPHIVVLIGTIPLSIFTSNPHASIHKLRGKVIKQQGRIIFPMYDMAFVMRDGNEEYKRLFVKDFINLNKIVEHYKYK